MEQKSTSEKLQSVISDDLFPQVQHISDVKQVLEEMEDNAQSLREQQLQGTLYLEYLGDNSYIHKNGNPYKKLTTFIQTKGKILVANPDYYLDTIESLIPKPPKPIVLAEKGGKR